MMAAASGSKARSLKILADDAHTLLTDELSVPSIQVAFQQTASVQAQEKAAQNGAASEPNEATP